MKRQKPTQQLIGLVAPDRGRSKWRGPRETKAVRFRRLAAEARRYAADKARLDEAMPREVTLPSLRRMPK